MSVKVTLRELGEQDAKAGKSIEAFFEIKGIRHNEVQRAEYEIGYRAERKEHKREPKHTCCYCGEDRFSAAGWYCPHCGGC